MSPPRGGGDKGVVEQQTFYGSNERKSSRET
jgi:hypothetical protein